jgi:uncharacterized protein (DUF1684 family)
MKKLLIIIFLTASYLHGFTQNDSAAVMSDIKKFRDGLNAEYKDASTSPLPANKRKNFKGIQFFPANMQYVVKASFTRTLDSKKLSVPTSGTEIQTYVKYGIATFTLLGKVCKLSIYQSPDLAKNPAYKDYLVVLFKDQTNGKETYGGGRYIDLTIPKDNTIIINFNKAYQPYCAYAEGYNCPIPPIENTLPLRVEAGVRF